MRKIFTPVLIFMVLFCVSAFADNKDFNHLKERVDAFYKAKIKADYREAFLYEHMSLDKKFTPEFYARNAAKGGVELLDVKCLAIEPGKNKNEAMVKMHIKYNIPPLPGFEHFNKTEERDVVEKWVFENGQWYHIIKGLTKEW